MGRLVPISEMPMDRRHWLILCVASLEQFIGTAVSTITGIMIPLILLTGRPRVDSFDQGVIGAAALAGIAAGSMIFGKLMDSMGYLLWFRLCPLIIAAGALGVFFSDSVWPIVFWLFVIGLGVGGGYSLDSGYISELMPKKWESFCVGLAKATSSLGFICGAGFGWLALKADPHASVWPYLILFIAFLGLITFLLRLRWHESPSWLESRGELKKADKAAQEFFGPDAEILPEKKSRAPQSGSWKSMLEGKSLDKVILSGLSWACEGLGVYGFGVFLPILVMALGMQGAGAEGIPKVLDSVRTTLFINIFVAVGFALGLAVLHKLNIFKLMGWSFIICAVSLLGLLLAFSCHWPVWTSYLFFIAFEAALNAGPHLVTFVVPARIFSIQERGAGTGIATMLGKLGAILGVFFMPALLKLGGIVLVLWVSIAVQLAGAAITFIYGKKLKLL